MNYFKFHSVGQGLFYSGSLANGTYNFVYDCGTESSKHYLNNAIDGYVNELKYNSHNPSIDFVVISHLHADHFNGLYELSKKAHINKVYLPYLGKHKSIIKIILYKTLVMDENIEDDNSNEFKNLAYRVACQLYGVDGEHYFPNIREAAFLGVEPNSLDEEGFCYSQQVDKLTIGTKDYWEFIFINKTISSEKLKKLLDNLKREINDFENKSLEEIIKTDDGLKTIASAYKKTFGKNQNITSTLLYHYPLYTETRWLRRMHYFRKYGWCCDLHNDFVNRRETLLAGDAEFPKKFTEELEELIKTGLLKQELGILQVPHHGAKANWDKFAKTRIMAKNYVVSFGLGNKYKHPSIGVVNDILSMEGKLWEINQASSFEYFIY